MRLSFASVAQLRNKTFNSFAFCCRRAVLDLIRCRLLSYALSDQWTRLPLFTAQALRFCSLSARAISDIRLLVLNVHFLKLLLAKYILCRLDAKIIASFSSSAWRVWIAHIEMKSNMIFLFLCSANFWADFPVDFTHFLSKTQDLKEYHDKALFSCSRTCESTVIAPFLPCKYVAHRLNKTDRALKTLHILMFWSTRLILRPLKKWLHHAEQSFLNSLA